MIADVDHEVIAAVIGAFAIVVVAATPLILKQAGRVRDNRVDLIALRERIDHIAVMMSEGQERRASEHRELQNRLERVLERVEDICGDGRVRGTR